MIILISRSISAAVAFFLAEIFIDLDHVLEYAYKFGILNFNLKRFFWAANNHCYHKFFLLLHSYELAAICWVLTLLVFRSPWAWGFSLGFTLHIIADHIYNPCHNLTYFLFFRIRHRFDGARLFPPGKWHKSLRAKMEPPG